MLQVPAGSKVYDMSPTFDLATAAQYIHRFAVRRRSRILQMLSRQMSVHNALAAAAALWTYASSSCQTLSISYTVYACSRRAIKIRSARRQLNGVALSYVWRQL